MYFYVSASVWLCDLLSTFLTKHALVVCELALSLGKPYHMEAGPPSLLCHIRHLSPYSVMPLFPPRTQGSMYFGKCAALGRMGSTDFNLQWLALCLAHKRQYDLSNELIGFLKLKVHLCIYILIIPPSVRFQNNIQKCFN